ncbi:MAG: single-stranded-DNA-specific exonuclease RecJ [Alphaproteobacteria bacterium]|nr:single-stranded-DNA-specific exonuclease RecJ [Alphaproteobacteria bacterium]
MDAFLGVERSLSGARWVMPGADLLQIGQLAQRFNLPEAIARLLHTRGITETGVEQFLRPTLRDHLPDPCTLQGMAEMAAFAAQAIIDQKKFAIFGDFDVDGATSSALLYRFLRACGIEATVYIPERLTEGYGPNTAALQTLRNNGAEILFLLDCGTTAHETVAAGQAMGLEIIILDHHEPEDQLAPATHVINPKRRDDNSGLSMLAAVGVTFMACVAINKVLREHGFFESRPAPSLKDFLDLVALGTVCDMVPLTGVNRLLVRQGFAVMNRLLNPGIKALAQVSSIEPPFTPYHLGFMLGPRINAGSRVHESDLGAKLLCTDDEAEAQQIAWLLHDCNEKRKALQAQMEREALAMVETQNLAQEPIIIVDHPDWHTGLAGLVAGKIKDQFGRPAVVIAYAENAQGVREGRGSGRSVPGVSMADAFSAAVAEGLLVKGGGHAMAGGFTVLPQHIENLRAFLRAHVLRQSNGAPVVAECCVDGVLSVRGVQVTLVQMLENFIGPFGQGFEEPVFALGPVRVHAADVLGSGGHVRVMISDWEGGPRIKAMAFGGTKNVVGQALLKQGRDPFYLLGHLKLNRWQGRESAEFHIKDAAPVMGIQSLQMGTQ